MSRVLFLFLIASISAHAGEILRDEHQDKVYDFEADTSEIPATLNQAEAGLKARDWAIRFYNDSSLQTEACEFRIQPTRFWLVTFARSNGEKVYAVVLPNGAIVESHTLTRS